MRQVTDTLAVAIDSLERVILADLDGRLTADVCKAARDICHRAARLEEMVPDDLRVRGPRPMRLPSKDNGNG